jgi:tetratricopeptide (TPR) repeat protein
MMRIIILAVFVFLCGFGFAQKTVIELKPTIGDDDNGKPLAGATVEIYKNGVLLASETTASVGKSPSITVPVCENCKYTIFIKKEGYVTKMAILDGSYDYPEELPPGTVEQRFDASIFRTVEGIDFSFLEREPMVEFAINSEGFIGFDQKQINLMKQKIEDLKKKMAVKKEQLAKEDAERAKKEADFNLYVAAGDLAMKQKEYEKAIGQYTLALGIRQDDQPTKDKIADARIKLEELKSKEQLDKDFAAKMTAGKAAYAANELEKALGLIREASALKQLEQLPKDLIAEIEKKIADQKNNQAAFNKLVSEGDLAITSEKYDDAIAKYTAALKLQKDAAVEAKLADATKKKAEKEGAAAALKANQDKYNQFIAKADAAFTGQRYDEAKLNYEEASKVFPTEVKPKDRLAEIDKILKDRAAEIAAKDKLEADYKKLIEEGKAKFTERNWQESKAKYEAALDLKQGDPTSTSQLALIQKELEKDAANAKLNAQYETAMKDGQLLFDQKKYIEAKAKFNEAHLLKNLETAPKEKIAAVDLILSNEVKAAKAEEDYKKMMTEGNTANDRKDYPTALDRYKKALDLKPGDAAAQSKIDAINKIVADQNKLAEDQKKFNAFVLAGDQASVAKDYDKAKLNYNNALGIKDDPIIRKKIEDLNALIAKNQSESETNAKYDAVIKEADMLAKGSDLQAALDKYSAANSIKETDYAKGKIAEFKTRITEQNALAEKDKQLKDLVAAGDAAYAASNYAMALEKYKESIKSKPDPTITEKITKINGLIAEQGQNAEKKAKYDAKILEAEKVLKDENWSAAILLFEEAGRILPLETYPGQKVAEIKKIMADETLAETERSYQKLIQTADKHFADDNLAEAKVLYQRALTFKQSDPYPKGKLLEISQKTKEKEDAAAAERAKNERYALLLKEGEVAYNTSNYQLALTKYKEANSLKPDEALPKSKIAEIEGKLGAAELQKQKDAEYKAAIDKGDQLVAAKDYTNAIISYKQGQLVKMEAQEPKDKIKNAENLMNQASASEKEAAYQKLLADAQAKLDAKEYDAARLLYNAAKLERPADPIPPKKIAEINDILSKTLASNDLEKKYNDFISAADFSYEKGDFIKAKEAYTNAYNLFNRNYPEDMIKKCQAALASETASSENREYDKIIKKADEYFNAKNYASAKTYYERAKGFKPTDPYPTAQLDEIERLLNPSVVVTKSPGLTNYGEPNRSADAVNIDNMLANAEEERKFRRTKKTEQQGLDASEAVKINSLDQVEESYDTRETVIVLEEEQINFIENADAINDGAADALEVMTSEYKEIQGGLAVDNTNNSQRQNQIVTNMKIELVEVYEDNDLDREKFELDAEAIKLETSEKIGDFSTDQVNETFDQKEYVEDYVETRIESDPNRDINRINTTVKVEDKQIQLINENNESIWDQENVVMKIKDETETLIDERIASDFEADFPREEGLLEVENQQLDLIEETTTAQNNQYDGSIGQKIYTENILNEIEIASIGNDIPRQKMEAFVEDQVLEMEVVKSELMDVQETATVVTKDKTDELEIEIIENQIIADNEREGYELIVTAIAEEKIDAQDELTSNTTNESHSTVKYIEDGTLDRTTNADMADKLADQVGDKTAQSVGEMLEKNKEINENGTEARQKSEEYVQSIKDININEIDEKMKNALGSQFPEGMTEEVYTNLDEDGLMVSYVVRRVVVRNGVGNVYEKVQTKFGTTSYSCNGVGITEYDFQDQTQAADLVRN